MKAKVTDELIENIFFKNTPLHDGAVIINENKILAARCILPVSDRRDIPGSVAFVPSVAGLIIAGEVVKDLAGIKKK